MPTNGHDWCPEPTRGTRQSAILLELLWCRPRVSVLRSPLPGLWPNGSLVDTTYIELLSYGLLHRDHSQYLRGWSDSPSHLPWREPTIELMDTLPPLTMENLLATAGVSRGCKPQTPPRIPTAPGPRQMRPKMPHQQAPTPGRQEAMQATPYRQQVFPPKCPAPKPSTTPSAGQDHGDPAGEAGGAWGRSSSRGPQDRRGRSRSSTRGSRKCRRADPSDSLVD